MASTIQNPYQRNSFTFDGIIDKPSENTKPLLDDRRLEYFFEARALIMKLTVLSEESRFKMVKNLMDKLIQEIRDEESN